MVWSPAWINPRPCGPIRNPPSRRPIKPGSPKRLKASGPSRITRKTTKNSSTTPWGAEISASGNTSVLRQDQRDVVEAFAEPAGLEVVDRAVGLKRADGGVDDLEIRRAVGECGSAAFASGQLADGVEATRVGVRERGGHGKIEHERLGAAGPKLVECCGAILDDV